MKNNPRISAKERGLIKGALRRVFSRSELRLEVVNSTRIYNYCDPNRPRVKKWSKCTSCQKPTPTYLMQVDHEIPVVPIDKTLLDMTADELVDNLWCDKNNLDPMCKPCHSNKTKIENKERRLNKKKNKGNVNG